MLLIKHSNCKLAMSIKKRNKDTVNIVKRSCLSIAAPHYPEICAKGFLLVYRSSLHHPHPRACPSLPIALPSQALACPAWPMARQQQLLVQMSIVFYMWWKAKTNSLHKHNKPWSGSHSLVHNGHSRSSSPPRPEGPAHAIVRLVQLIRLSFIVQLVKCIGSLVHLG